MLCSIKEELSVEKLKGVKLWITAGPREKFTASEVICIKAFHSSGMLHNSFRKNEDRFLQTYPIFFSTAGGAEALPGQRRKHAGHAWRGRRNEIWNKHQFPPGGVWNNGQQWCVQQSDAEPRFPGLSRHQSFSLSFHCNRRCSSECVLQILSPQGGPGL